MTTNAKFITYLKNVAKGLRESAGYGGAYHDGGAQALEHQIQVYEAAQNGNIPIIWDRYYDEFLKFEDPEYQQYLRLKQKFE